MLAPCVLATAPSEKRPSTVYECRLDSNRRGDLLWGSPPPAPSYPTALVSQDVQIRAW